MVVWCEGMGDQSSTFGQGPVCKRHQGCSRGAVTAAPEGGRPVPSSWHFNDGTAMQEPPAEIEQLQPVLGSPAVTINVQIDYEPVELNPAQASDHNKELS